MMFTTVIGNIKDMEHEGLELETITIPSDHLQKKVIRVMSDFQNEYGINIKDSDCCLEDGSVFFQNNQKMVVLKVEEDKCIVIQPKDMNQMGQTAHYLGNMHMPVDIKDNTITLHYDAFLEQDLAARRIPFSVGYKKLDKALKHVEFGHKH